MGYMLEKVITLLKEQTINIPKILMTNYKELQLTDQEFILVSYLLNTDYFFNPKRISSDLKIELPLVFELITSLEAKDIVKIETRQVKNIREEFLNFDGLYNKLAFFIVNDKVKPQTSTNLFDIFEQEFGRTLSPIEYEIIKGWKDVQFEEELIILALKEATYNGVSNLRYIDKILYDWKKRGIKTKEDVERSKAEFNQRNQQNKQELFDYDWLNEHE